MTLSKAITAFVDELRATGKAKQTCAAYESDLRRLAANAKHDSVLAFTGDLVKNHLLQLSSVDNAAMATLHRKRSCYGQFAKWGVINDLWKTDPIAKVPTVKRPKHLPRPFSKDDTAALWALDLPPMEAVARAVLFLTGLRVSPVCGIKLGDISYDPPSIRALVKGSKIQVVSMPKELGAMIHGYVLSSTDLKGHSPLFRKPRGAPYRRQEFEEMVARWGKAAGVVDCTPHRFRHTFATRLLELTKDLRLVQEAMGHADIASTTIYTKVAEGAVAAAVSGLSWNALLPRAEET
jgi:site-specific recombinase XerD